MNEFRFESTSKGVIIGAGHGIGKALFDQLKASFPYLDLIGTYANSDLNENPQAFKLDPLNEEEIKAWAVDLEKIDFVISCVGMLGDEPEKSLRDIDLEKLTKSFQVNAIHFPLVIKHLYRKLQPNSLLTCLSAMVGSVDDNKMGGWYGYRASKSALNMFIRNISIELKKSIVVAVHPGTTYTRLSDGFLSNISHQIYTPQETAVNLIEFFESRNKTHSGKLFHWDGRELTY